MPASRPDLDQELRQQLLDRMLRDYERDRRDGKTTRGLYDLLKSHIDNDAVAFAKLDEKIDSARLETAAVDGRIQGVTDTGRFMLPPTQINIEQPKLSKRPSVAPFWQKIAEKPAVMILVALTTLLLHAIFRLLK